LEEKVAQAHPDQAGCHSLGTKHGQNLGFLKPSKEKAVEILM